MCDCQSNETHTMKNGAACVVCNGCPENRIDSARVETYLEENGWLITKDYKNADLILFTACALTQEVAAVSLEIIKEIQSKKKEGSRLIVWGCLAKIDPILLRSQYEDRTFSEAELSLLPQMIGSILPIEKTTANYLLPRWPLNERIGKGSMMRYEGSQASRLLKSLALRWDSLIESRFNLCRENDPSIFYIKVLTGCLSNCAYCGVRKSRGLLKSKPTENVVRELQEGLQKGFRSFSFLGTDVGAYGKDMGCTLTDLLKEVVKQKEHFKIGLRNVNPYHLKNMLEEFVPLLKSERMWYMECPAESGSNRILKLMNRNYTIEEFKGCIEVIRKASPKTIIRTQLMVGFPTETEQDFSETMHLLDDEIFDYAEVYKYSTRPGTLAANMEPQVPEQIKKRRFLKLYRKALLNRTPRKIMNLIQH